VVVKHGAYSRPVKRRWRDKRTTEGRELHRIIDGIIEDCGGQEALSASQRLLVDIVRSKLTVLLQLARYVDRQQSIIGSDGQPLACLNKLHLGYSESLRRDLECLHGLDRRQKKPGPSLAEWIKENATK